MHLVIKLLLFVAVCLSHGVISQSTDFNTSVIPIFKDADTSLHKIAWSFLLPLWEGEVYYLLDLDAPFTWKDCIIRHIPIACGLEEGCRFPLQCDDILCKEAQSYLNPTCPSLNITAKYGCRICAATPSNPISKTCKLSQLTTDLVTIYTTNGRNPIQVPRSPFGTEFVLSCAPSSLLRSFPKSVRGVASFSWSSLGFPRQVYNRNQAAKFALCLPSSSSSAPGVTFLGDGPFHFTSLPNVDLRSTLSYTPMVRRNSKSLGYYIKVNRISIKGTPVMTKSVSVKLSTVVPYTILRSDIYKSLTASFSKAVKNIPGDHVTAVKPFSLCLKAAAVGSVPSIDLETESGKTWRISRDNLMKDSGNGASCLAFIDGGSGVKDAVVIGTFQMENNFLFFDLVNQKLGFSSSLLRRGTSCGGFNFTVTP